MEKESYPNWIKLDWLYDKEIAALAVIKKNTFSVKKRGYNRNRITSKDCEKLEPVRQQLIAELTAARGTEWIYFEYIIDTPIAKRMGMLVDTYSKKKRREFNFQQDELKRLQALKLELITELEDNKPIE